MLLIVQLMVVYLIVYFHDYYQNYQYPKIPYLDIEAALYESHLFT